MPTKAELEARNDALTDLVDRVYTQLQEVGGGSKHKAREMIREHRKSLDPDGKEDE